MGIVPYEQIIADLPADDSITGAIQARYYGIAGDGWGDEFNHDGSPSAGSLVGNSPMAVVSSGRRPPKMAVHRQRIVMANRGFGWYAILEMAEATTRLQSRGLSDQLRTTFRQILGDHRDMPPWRGERLPVGTTLKSSTSEANQLRESWTLLPWWLWRQEEMTANKVNHQHFRGGEKWLR